jgi:2-polyprenyl-3-methyl-5-hydroxy-6-metoxy-1,4-benzoquinol methylase
MQSDLANPSLKTLLKNSVSPLLWRRITTPYRASNHALEKMRRPYRIWKWKRQLATRAVRANQQEGEIAKLHNQLPNSGGVPIDATRLNIEEVMRNGYSNAVKRRAGITGYEGLALDDAMGWIEDYRHYSFVPLARAVSNIAHQHFGRPFSVLELGCGWGGFRVLLQTFGASSYLGIDANPLPFKYSPFMLQSPISYRLLNLQETVDFGRCFDVVCSFEVLEHIGEDRLDFIMQTISKHLSESSLFIGTAALTDYTDVHVTVHDRNWWLERFDKHRLLPVPEAKETHWIKALARNHPFNWNSSTTSIFVLQREQRS